MFWAARSGRNQLREDVGDSVLAVLAWMVVHDISADDELAFIQ